MTRNSKIGIFDSGIGGSTVLKEILKVLPKENYIYYSDSKNNPYGDKTETEIFEICDNIVEFLFEKGCKIIVIACNTASAIAIDKLRNKYPDKIFIGIEPAYKMVYDYNFDSETLVMATKGTINSEKFNILYNKYDNHKTHLLSCVGLADIIEEGNEEKIKKYLKDNLAMYKGKVENIVLGCTHYPLIINELREELGKVRFFEGSERIAIHLKNVLEEINLINDSGNSEIEFIDTSGLPEKEKRFYEILKG